MCLFTKSFFALDKIILKIIKKVLSVTGFKNLSKITEVLAKEMINIKHDRINPHPFNDGFKIMYNEFPRELHDNLGVPVVYKEKISNLSVYSKKGIIGEMDVSYIVGPDYKTIFEPMIFNGEHQSTKVDEEKIKMMCQYAFQQIADVNLPQFTYVASHIKKEEHLQKYACTPTHLIKPLYIITDEKNNAKRLIKIKKIINNNNTLSDLDALNLGIITLFAPRDNALEITEEVIELYIKFRRKFLKKWN